MLNSECCRCNDSTAKAVSRPTCIAVCRLQIGQKRSLQRNPVFLWICPSSYFEATKMLKQFWILLATKDRPAEKKAATIGIDFLFNFVRCSKRDGREFDFWLDGWFPERCDLGKLPPVVWGPNPWLICLRYGMVILAELPN